MLSFIIFGTKTRSKEYGPAYPAFCNRCQNESFFQLGKARRWFHIFWIPLIPWSADRLLYCEICGESIELDKGEFKHATDLVGDTQRFRERELSEAEYEQILEAFKAEAPSLGNPTEANELSAPGGTEGPDPDGESLNHDAPTRQ